MTVVGISETGLEELLDESEFSKLKNFAETYLTGATETERLHAERGIKDSLGPFEILLEKNVKTKAYIRFNGVGDYYPITEFDVVVKDISLPAPAAKMVNPYSHFSGN